MFLTPSSFPICASERWRPPTDNEDELGHFETGHLGECRNERFDDAAGEIIGGVGARGRERFGRCPREPDKSIDK